MTLSSKLCDAADWFHPEMMEIIRDELHEMPRLHRKQWEFAMIFLALRRRGMLKADRIGLAMGAGRERLLYAIGRHVKRLVVSDLYDEETSWGCARTRTPEEFIRENCPFPAEDACLEVIRMDMREIEFPDRTFDFCYSSSAIEHIGDRADFVRHLNEVARVLRTGGVYALTTEVHYGKETIADRDNFVFSTRYLSEIISESALTPLDACEARITDHEINNPLPERLGYFLQPWQASVHRRTPPPDR
jgi:SAM-dependent methyltransferase